MATDIGTESFFGTVAGTSIRDGRNVSVGTV